MDDSNNTLKTPSVTDRLISLVTEMSDEEQENLLKELEAKFSKERRRYPRKPFATLVDFVSEGRGYTEFTQNISKGGLYIETMMPFSVSQDVVMTFTFPDSQRPVKIAGKIVRVNDSGIGVQFQTNKPLEALSISSPLKRL